MTTIGIRIAKKVSNGNYGSDEVGIWIEEEVQGNIAEALTSYYRLLKPQLQNLLTDLRRAPV